MEKCPCFASPPSADRPVILARKIIRSLTDVRPAMRPWAGRLPAARVSPSVTLGDCVVRDARSNRMAKAGNLRDILHSTPACSGSSEPPVRTTSFPKQRSILNAIPLATANCDPCKRRSTRATFNEYIVAGQAAELILGPIKVGSRPTRRGTLADRFLSGCCDVEAANKLTLAANPSSCVPSYLNVACHRTSTLLAGQ